MTTSASSPPPRPKKLINLLRGWPAPSLLPNQPLLSSATTALTDSSAFVPGLQYGPDPGYLPLRQEISAWLSQCYGVEPDVERICITGGASQNIACVLQSFTDPAYTRAVWMVAPCYFLAGPIFEDGGFYGRRGKLRGFAEDAEGPDVEELEREILKVEEGEWPGEPVYKHPSPERKAYKHIIYVVPTCANPPGTTMSLRRRRALVDLARKYDALVICDDVYDFLQWCVTPSSLSPATAPAPLPLPAGTPLPRLVDIDLSLGRSAHEPAGGKWFGHAVSNGTFSKLIGPGVRTGWAEAAPDFAYGLSQTGSSRSGGAPSQFAAMVVAEMLRTGALDRHVAGSVRPALRRRHGMILEAVREALGRHGVEVKAESQVAEGTSQTVEGVYGGYFVWLTLPEEGPTAKEVAGRAKREENLIVAEGDMFEVPGDERSPRFGRNLRLTFSWEDEGDVVEGVRRLGAVLGRMRDGVEEAVVDGYGEKSVYK